MDARIPKKMTTANARTPPTLICGSSRHGRGRGDALRGVRPARQRHATRCNATDDRKEEGAAGSVLSFLCPLLKLFTGGDAAAPRARWSEVATSGFASISRLSFGTSAGPASLARASDPVQPLSVYEFEACPFCRRVREAVTDLDLTVNFYPCPKDSVTNRSVVMGTGGKSMFPFLIDPNTGAEMYESADIVKYLYETYGGGEEPPSGLLESTLFTGWVPTLLRAGRGMSRYDKAYQNPPKELLVLYNYENNQFSRLVREALCELELPFTCVSAGKGSKNRNELEKVQGKTTVPFLVDPNTDKKIGDSEEIVEYLFKTYSSYSEA
ncbi:hypothetical protein BSKO_03667 [Bryopsis sp. KO-2023]|nr:hypothetical protein BSKO_03667 [Bryopsis sp. KO-2023]